MKRLHRVAAGLAGVLLFAVSLLPLTPIAAAVKEGEGITMAPVNKHYELLPGDTKSDTVTIINHGSTDYDFTVRTGKYDVESEDYSAETGDVSNPMSNVGDWVSFDTTTYHLKSGENTTVPFTVKVPEEATPGAHTGTLFATIKPNATEGIIMAKSVGLVMYANIGGDIQKQGSVEGISVPFYLSSSPITVSARYINTGNAFYVATSEMVVYDLFGNKLGHDEKEFTVLPDRPRKAELSVDNLGLVGIYKVDGSTTFLDQTTPFSGYVVILPIWLMLTVIMTIGVLIVYLRYRKDYKSVHFKR